MICKNCLELNYICEYCLTHAPIDIQIQSHIDYSSQFIENEISILYEDREEIWMCYGKLLDIRPIKNNWETLESGINQFEIPYKKYKEHIIKLKSIYYV